MNHWQHEDYQTWLTTNSRHGWITNLARVCLLVSYVHRDPFTSYGIVDHRYTENAADKLEVCGGAKAELA